MGWRQLGAKEVQVDSSEFAQKALFCQVHGQCHGTQLATIVAITNTMVEARFTETGFALGTACELCSSEQLVAREHLWRSVLTVLAGSLDTGRHIVVLTAPSFS